MSPKNPLLSAGLTALGLFGFATLGVADPGAPGPSGLSASPAPSPTPAVLLLTNGSAQPGLVTDVGPNYVLHCRGGKIPVPKSKVVQVFNTLEEVYQYKRTQFPEVDPDEHMKLARWCLTNRLKSQAKAELQTVLVLSPSHAPARAMLQSIENEEERAALPLRDEGLARAGGEVAEGPVVRPEEVNPADLIRMRKVLNIPDTPQIFDLPPALAVKRANEFAISVHPILQTYCARCHNEQYPGRFQLTPVKTRRDRNADVLKANLDATLRLIDPQDLSNSEILSSSLVPHGSGATKRPIFRGANDSKYQILAAWVNSLRSSRPVDSMTASGFASQAPASRAMMGDGRFGTPGISAATMQPSAGGEGFATARGGPEPLPMPLTPTPSSEARLQPPPISDTATPLPPGQFLPGSGSGAQPYAPPNAEFPAPYMAGGPRPKLSPTPTPTPTPNPDGKLPEPPAGAPKKKTQPVQIPQQLLEGVLMNRYGQP